MPQPLQPGPPGEPLPDGEDVLRLLRASKDGRASELAFTLSPADEASVLVSLSVFARRLTRTSEALALMEPEKQAAYRRCALLGVEAIRALRPSPDSPDVPALDVVWDPLEVSPGQPGPRPGAAGHAGITGLLRPVGLANAKLFYKSLRSQLADLANQRLLPTDAGFSEGDAN